MTRFDVAVLALRLLALYVWLQTGLQFSNFAHQLALVQDGPLRGPRELAGWLLSVLLLLGFGLLLFVATPSIARHIFRDNEPIQSASRRVVTRSCSAFSCSRT